MATDSDPGAAESAREFLPRLSDALRPLADAAAVQAAAARLLGERLGVDRAYYVEVDEARGVARVGSDYLRGDSPSLAGEHRVADFGWVIPPMRRGEVLVVPDVARSELVPAADRPAMAALRIGAHVNAPLVKGGDLVGALCVTEPGPRDWRPDEVELVRETAERIWEAVGRAGAEEARRASDEQYRTLFAAMRQGYALCELARDGRGQAVDFRYLEINPAFQTLTGLDPAAVLGRRLSDVLPGVEPFWLETYARVVETGRPARFERELPEIGRWLDVAAYPRGGDRFAALFDDVTARRRAEEVLRESGERQAFLLRLSDALRPLTDPVEIQSVAARTLGVYLAVSRAIYGSGEGDGEHFVVSGVYHREGLASAVGRYRLDDFGKYLGETLRAGRPCVVDDLDAKPELSGEERAAYRGIGVRAFACVSLIKDGKNAAVFGLHQSEPRAWTAREVTLLGETAERTWAAVERARAEAALRASEAKYRTLFETMGQGYALGELVRDASGRAVDIRYLELNPAFERLTGVPAGRARGRTAREVFGAVEGHWLEAADRVARAGRFERVEYELAAAGRWYAAYLYPAGGDRYLGLYEDVTERKRAELEQAFRVRLGDSLRPLSDPVAIQEAACRVLGEHLGADRTYYGELDYAAEAFVVERDYVRGAAPSLVGVHPWAAFGLVLRALRAGRSAVVADAETDPLIAPADRPAYAAISVRSFATVPLIKGGVCVSAMAVADVAPRGWRADEAALVLETAERTWEAVERARAEAALRASEERYRLAAGAFAGVVYDWNPVTGRVTRTPGLLGLVGFTPEEAGATADWWGERIHPDDREARDATRRAVAGTADHYVVEYRVRHRDGHWVDVWDRGLILRDAAGAVARVVGSTIDVTARRRAEVALRASEARFRRLFDADLIGIFTVLEDGRVLDANDAFLRLVGRTRADLAAGRLDWKAMTPPDELEAELEAAKTRLGPDGEVAPYEKTYLRPDGTRVPVLLGGAFVEGASGEGVCFALDLTERKRAEAGLRESEERFRGLAEAVPLIVWSGTDAVVDYFNSHWFAYTGLTPENGLGEAWFDTVHPDDRAAVLEKSAESGRTGAVYEAEYRLRRADGAYRWHIARAARVASLGRWFGTATDVHEQRLALEALREREEQLALAQRAAGMGVSSLDLGTMTGITTPEWRAVMGMPPPPAPQDFATFLTLVHPGDRERVAALHAAPPGPDGLEFEFRVLHPERGERWILSRSRRLPDPAGGAGRLVGIALDVTDRRLAESAARESEARYRAIAANLPNGAAFIVDRDLRYTLAEGHALRAAGFTPADFEGKTVAEALPPELAGDYEPRYRALLAGVPFRAEHAAHGRHFVTHGVPLRDAEGNVAAALAVSYDITDRIRAEEARRESEAKLRLSLRAARTGIWTWDAARDVHVRDENLNRLLGLGGEPTEDSVEEFYARIHPADRERVRAVFAEALERGESFSMEFRVVRPDRSVVWLRDQGDAVRGPGGAVAALAGACVDITDLKEVEAARRAGEERLRLILASATDFAIFTLAPDRTVTEWSQGAAAVFGWSAAEILGQPADVVFTPEDRLAGAPEAEVAQALRTGRAADERWHLRKDGSRFYASGVLAPLGGDGGGFVKVLRDLTGRKRLEDELRAARDRLEDRVTARTAELQQAVGELLAEARLREAAEAGRVELLRRLDAAQEAERRRLARDLHDQVGQTLTGLGLAAAAGRADEVRRLADEVARELHSVAVRLRPTALDDVGLEAALGQLVADWSRRTGVPAELHTAGIGHGRLPPDVETGVYRVVQEALTNAAKHAKPTRVGVTVLRPDGFVSVAVEDDGVGFDPEAAGAGRLGLLGMRERVELLGGTLEVESAPGQGTTVLARLPLG